MSDKTDNMDIDERNHRGNDDKIVKKKYFMNCFKFLMDAYAPYMPEYEFTHHFVQEGFLDFIKDYFVLRRMIKNGELDGYDVVHINNWLNFLNLPPAHKRKNQVWIAHSHGVHIGIDLKIGISQSSRFKKMLAYITGPLLCIVLRNRIKKFDLCYVAIPNALQFAKQIRDDFIWMPNPIDFTRFNTEGEVMKLVGNPAIIYPTRLHDVKNPEYAFNLYIKIKKRYPSAKLHIIKYPERFQNSIAYKNIIRPIESEIVYHGYMDIDELASFYRGADIILGAFSKHDYYANLNLVELEAMACGGIVIAHDRFEIINKSLDELERFTYKLIDDKEFREVYRKNCISYVHGKHNPENIVKLHRENVRKIKNNKNIKK